MGTLLERGALKGEIMSKEIEITINEDGSIEADLHGFMGQGCSDVVDELAKSLGNIKTRDTKCDYYTSNSKTRKNKISNDRY